jgi:DNA-binding SARP family transcriptional activator
MDREGSRIDCGGRGVCGQGGAVDADAGRCSTVGRGYAGAGINMISGDDAARRVRGGAGARVEPNSHGGVSRMPMQPVPPLLRASAGGARVELRVLGPVEAVVAGRLVDLGPLKQRALFALLVSRVGRPVAVDVLLEELWVGAPPPAAMTSLRAYVSNLRRVLEPHRAPRTPATVLRTRAPGYLLDSRGADLDVWQFTCHATAGWEAWGRGEPHRALAEFEAGLALWRGEAYAEVRDAVWAAPEVARLEELRLSVVEGRCAALIELGRHEVAVAELEAHVQAHPLREHGCELLALSLYRAGRQADALAVLRATRTRLAEELGIDPGTALQHLERDILTQAPVLDWQPPVSRRAVAAVTVARRVSTTGPAPVEEHDIFIGRQEALQRLVDALDGAVRGRGRVVLVAGEPGVGKTGLLRRFAELAGVPVVWGSCPEHVAAPPLWPWEKVLRAVRTQSPERQVPGPVTELLAGQVPEMVEVSDVVGAALRRFEAIGQYLTAGPEPLVVMLDDLHWADLTSLRLLAHLADTITTSRLLLVASYRCHESAALNETLAALTRADALRIELAGLDAEETQTLVSAVTGREVSKSTAARLCARTEGNPFFLRELIRLLTSEHRLDQPEMSRVPVPVREVVLRRIARLPQATAAVLSVAAIAGRDFDVDVVAEAASVEIEAALEAIDTAVAAGLVVEDPHRLGWFSFTHALVAEALFETTTRARRARRHRRIGAAAARVWAGHTERAAEIARHWLLAAGLDSATAAQACAYAATAARVAEARLAPDDAAESWRQALAAAELAGDVDSYPLLMGLATSLYRAGNPRGGLPVFVRAMQQALTEGHGADISQLVTTVVAAISESNWYPVVAGVDDEQLIDVLERALPRLTDPVQRALLLSCLATARYYDDDPQRRVALSDQALALARPAADTVALARVLRLRLMALYGPDYPELCMSAITELLGLPGLPPPLLPAARLSRAMFLPTVGRIPEAAAELDLLGPIVEQSGSPLYRMRLGWARAGLLLLAGRWSEADAISRTTYNLHSGMSYGLEQGFAPSVRMMQRWEAAYLAGTGADLVDELRAAVEATDSRTLRSILAMALVEAGRPEDCRAVLHHLAPGPKDYRWLYTQCWGLLAATRVGETERVTRLRDQLLAYRRLPCAVSAVLVSGSVAYFTGEAALALGEPDAALADLTVAVEADEAMGAFPWLARARDAISRAQRLRQAGGKPPQGPSPTH